MWRIVAGTRFERDHRRGDDGIGRREHRAEQERLGPGEVEKSSFAAERQQHERDRHRDHERPGRRAPVAAEQLAVDEQPVGDQRQDQRQLDQLDDARLADVDRDHARSASTIPSVDRQHRGREHGPADQPRERRRHREQRAEDQQRFAERRCPSAGMYQST